MKLSMRQYKNENDYWNIRAFLRQVFMANGRLEYSWQPSRLDYWRWHCVGGLKQHSSVADVTFIWENGQGEIAAVLNPEVRAEAFLQIHPQYKSRELEEEMILMAEEKLAGHTKDGSNILTVWAHDDDPTRQDVLAVRGFRKDGWAESQRHFTYDRPISEGKIPEGYTIRGFGKDDDLPKRSWASWQAFHPNEPIENYDKNDEYWYRYLHTTPLYRHSLDILAIAPDDSIAAFATLWYDDVTRAGYFEPVGTVPAHQRKGLGRAVMTEAMHRARKMGAEVIVVGGFTEAANALYASAAPGKCLRLESWEKK